MQLHEAHWILLKIIAELNQSISSGATKRQDRDEKNNDNAHNFRYCNLLQDHRHLYDCQCEPMNTHANQCERNIHRRINAFSKQGLSS